MIHEFVILNLLTLLLISVSLSINYYIIEKENKQPLHALNFALTAIYTIVVCMLLYDSYFRFVAMLYAAFMYWVLFNLTLNLLRGKPPLYLGEWSILDTIEYRMKNPGATMGIKIIVMIMCSFVILDL